MKKVVLVHLFILVQCIIAAGNNVNEVNISGQGITEPIGKDLTYFSDTTGKMTLNEVLNSGRFHPSEGSIPRFGLTKSSHWMRFALRNSSNEAELAVALLYPGIDELNLYINKGDGFKLVAKSGLAQVSKEEIPAGGDQQYALPIAPGERAEIMIQMKGFKPLHAPIITGTSAAMIESRTPRNVALGLYMGIMLVLFLYNIFVYVSTKDRNYLFYVLSILALSCTQLSLMGHGPFNYLNFNGWLTSRSGLLFNLLAIPLGYAFARGFMNTKHFVPGMDRWVPMIYLIIAAIASTYLIIDPWLGQELGNSISGIAALYLLTMGVVALRKGSRQAAFFLLAWTAFLVGVVLFVLKDEGVIPYTSLTIYAMPLGSAIEGILLSFGLADRINVLRREKEFSQAAALASSLENERIIREQNAMLEEKVTERTHALQETNEHLKLTQTKLVNAEKMASLGQLTAGIAHEINNPINFITSNILPLRRNITEIVEVMQAYRALEPAKATEQLKALKDREKKLGINESIEELDDIIGSIAEGSSRTAEIVRGLRNFSRLDEDDLKEVDLNDGLRSTIALLAPQYREKVAIELELGLTPAVECYPGKVNQVFMNVLTNAFQATIAKADCASPLVRIATRSEGDRVIITVKDNGIGMSQEVRSRMFEPFFTTKAVGDGTGLGLAIVYGIIEDHHGTISAETAIGLGTELRIEFPIQHPREQQRRA